MIWNPTPSIFCFASDDSISFKLKRDESFLSSFFIKSSLLSFLIASLSEARLSFRITLSCFLMISLFSLDECVLEFCTAKRCISKKSAWIARYSDKEFLFL